MYKIIDRILWRLEIMRQSKPHTQRRWEEQVFTYPKPDNIIDIRPYLTL